MKKYIPIEKLINNENVIHILSEARLPGEKALYLKIIKKNDDEEIFEAYVVKNEIFSENNLNYLAIIRRDKKGWHINFKA